MSNSNRNGLLLIIWCFLNSYFFSIFFVAVFFLQIDGMNNACCTLQTAHTHTHTSYSFIANTCTDYKIPTEWSYLVFSLGLFVANWYANNEKHSQKCEVSAFYFGYLQHLCSPAKTFGIWIGIWPKNISNQFEWKIDAVNSHFDHGLCYKISK